MVVQCPRLLQPVIDERLEQLQRHLLGQPALVQLQLGTDHDDRAAGVVHALAQQVLAEAALLALERVGERLQRAVVGAAQHAAAAAVVEQRVHRLLQHALLVAHDDVGGVQLHQLLQPVVAVDDAAVEIVQIARWRSGRHRAEPAGAAPAGSPGSRPESSTPACCRSCGRPRPPSGAWRTSAASAARSRSSSSRAIRWRAPPPPRASAVP